MAIERWVLSYVCIHEHGIHEKFCTVVVAGLLVHNDLTLTLVRRSAERSMLHNSYTDRHSMLFYSTSHTTCSGIVSQTITRRLNFFFPDMWAACLFHTHTHTQPTQVHWCNSKWTAWVRGECIRYLLHMWDGRFAQLQKETMLINGGGFVCANVVAYLQRTDKYSMSYALWEVRPTFRHRTGLW